MKTLKVNASKGSIALWKAIAARLGTDPSSLVRYTMARMHLSADIDDPATWKAIADRLDVPLDALIVQTMDRAWLAPATEPAPAPAPDAEHLKVVESAIVSLHLCADDLMKLAHAVLVAPSPR